MTEFSIYQINMDRDSGNVCFIGMESLEKIKGTKEVNAAAYDRVYDGKMDCISLENIYQKFNVDHGCYPVHIDFCVCQQFLKFFMGDNLTQQPVIEAFTFQQFHDFITQM